MLGFSFAAGQDIGLVAAIAIVFHELPKELGTFALLGTIFIRMIRRSSYTNLFPF